MRVRGLDVVALLSMGACNWIYGLDGTKLEPVPDAAYFDAPADAPFTCPPPGGSPVFSRLLHQIPQTCSYYETSAATGRATAMCSDGVTSGIAIGPADGTLTRVPMFEQIGANRLDLPHLAPEGDQLFVRNWNTGTLTSKLRVYAIAGDTFTMSHEVTIAGVTFDTSMKFGRPSAGPVRRMFFHNSGVSPLAELSVEPSGAARQVRTYTPAQLGVETVFAPPSLSADGLRIVFAGGTSMGSKLYYAARPSIDEPFVPGAAHIADLAYNVDPFLTEDCGRLYFSAIASVFWIQQQ